MYTKVVEPKKIELRRQLIEELRNSDEFDDESRLVIIKKKPKNLISSILI